jgi:uncharacterized protein (TIGR02466 family)
MWGEMPKSPGPDRAAASRPERPDVRRFTVPIFATPISNYLWPNSDGLNAALAAAILERERAHPGIDRSNVGGWHSDTDLFEWGPDCFKELRARLLSYITELFRSVAGNAQHAPSPGFRLEGWANVLRYGQYHSLHSHPNAFWSGVYYVTGNPAPEEAHPFSGKLEFIDPRPGASLNYTEGTTLYGRFLLNPTPGQMVTFPGWLQHQVHPFFGEGERVTVAFNAIVA